MRKAFVSLLVLVFASLGVAASTASICEVRCASDHSNVTTSGYMTNLRVSHDAYANFDIEDGLCQVHVYWNFPGSPPPWLKNDTQVEVTGEYQHYNPIYQGPEIVASGVTPTELPTDLSHSVHVPAPWTIVPWGAAGAVAGSCYQVTTDSSCILIDCGSYMNTDDMPTSKRGSHLDCDPFPFLVDDVDALVVTHAHEDHVARIHYLVAQGFAGPIHMTEATAVIYQAKLNDLINYSCLPREIKPAIECSIRRSIRTHPYLEPFQLADDVAVTFVDASHIPGSASVVLSFEAPNGDQTITFSGDIGSGHHPFLHPPDLDSLSSTGTTALVVESTYGYSDPREYSEDLYAEFYDVVQKALDNDQLVVIPAFALDRTQRVLAALVAGAKEGRIHLEKGIGIGGKSARYLTEAYIEMQADEFLCNEYFTCAHCSDSPFAGVDWEFIRTSSDDGSREYPEYAWNYDIVVTPSGTGSTSSYAKELIDAYADNPRVVFIQVGWVPSWSPLGELAGSGRVVNVHDAFSGHADIRGLVNYVAAFSILKRVIITHGDDDLCARQGLASAIHYALPDVEVLLPENGEVIPILD